MKLNKNRCVVGAVAIVATLTLAACDSGSGATPRSTSSESPSETPSASPSSSESPSETPSESDSAGAKGTPGELTGPGTTLAFGEEAVVHANAGDKADGDFVEATYTVTVKEIVAGSPDDLSVFKDAAKFAGQTPYYVNMDVRLDSLTAPSAGMGLPRVDGHLKDGSDAQKLIAFGSFDQCSDGSLETEGDASGDDFSYKVGSATTTCAIFLAPTGDAVTSASFSDPSTTYEEYGDNPYLDAPIIWK